MWNRKVFIRIAEVLLCVACVVALRVTDDESRRVFTYLRYRSREWSLLNNVTWGAIGAALATVTCGGYIIITFGLLLAAATGELRGRKTEIFFLGLGIILFGIVGALSLASIESVPEDLIDNAAVLGALCLVTALVFIADLLMSSKGDKMDQNTEMLIDPKLAKNATKTMLTMEKETKQSSPKGVRSTADVDEERVKHGHERDVREERLEDEQRSRPVETAEKQMREYVQNMENGKSYDAETKRYYMDSEQRSREKIDDMGYYRKPVSYHRPVDETDTPPFPNDFDGNRQEPVFAKIVNPGVKIMRVDRDMDDNFEGYRYSDSSQYDNVPTRMRTSILKRHRDVSFNVPPPPRSRDFSERTRDDIEMLEECFQVLRTTSTGTQTGSRAPSSATDPGYVRHTASNWPHDVRPKTPGSSPERDRN